MPRNIQISQFSDPTLRAAASLCGPAAAIAFARVNGRSPSLREAQTLAEQVGWTAEAGMAGPQSQLRLLEKMGIAADLAPSADWGRVTADVREGRPVTISTPRHYFTVSDADDQGRYYVGASGTDLTGGKEWMTADEITAAGRGVNGALHLRAQPRPETGPEMPATPAPITTPALEPAVPNLPLQQPQAQPPADLAKLVFGSPAPAASPYVLPAPEMAMPKPFRRSPPSFSLAFG